MALNIGIIKEPGELLDVKSEEEALKQDQYRLNYDKLKALNNSMETGILNHVSSESVDTGPTIKTLSEIQRGTNIVNQPLHYFRNKKAVSVGVFNNELEQLKNCMEKLEHRHICSGGMESRQICSQIIAQWERDYMALFREFENFQSAMATLIQSEAHATAEKAALMKSESDKDRIEYQDKEVKWEASNREYLREKGRYECEIRTLRSELEETRRNLGEKSIICDNLTRELDLAQLKNFPEKVCETTSVETLLKATQSRNSFLEEEIKCLSDRNTQLVKDIESAREQQYSSNKELKDTLAKLKLSVSQELDEVSTKMNELHQVIKTQQSYISEVEMLLRAKDDEIQEVVINTQNQVRNLVQESLESLHTMGIEKHAVMKAQEMLKNEFIKMKEKQQISSQSIKAHHQLSLRLCKQGLTQLSNIPDSVLKDFEIFLTHLSIMNNGQDQQQTSDNSNTNQSVDNMLLVEESMLSKLIDSILNSKMQSQTRQGQLQIRMTELDASLKLAKLRHSDEIERLNKKCKSYGQLIRKLRSRMQNSPQQLSYLRNNELNVVNRDLTHGGGGGGDQKRATKNTSKKSNKSKKRKTKKEKMQILKEFGNSGATIDGLNTPLKNEEEDCEAFSFLEDKHSNFQNILKKVRHDTPSKSHQ